jgi:hypothetical protein
MAPLATLADFRIFQPSLSGVSDAQVSAALDAVSEWARGIVGPVLTSDFGTGYVAKIRYGSQFGDRFVLPTKFATAITQIEGVAYTGVINTDYWLDGEEVTMPSLPAVASGAPYFTVKLTGGSACPTDLKNALCELAAKIVTRDAGREVSSQSLGPRSVTFIKDTDPSIMAAQAVVNKYQPVVA